ncbi:hypothetical protein ACFL3G_12860 [Planctomycetota bacterium]
MVEKDGKFFEKHIEKMVLAIAGVLSLWLLFTKVVITPNRVLFNERKYSCVEIDKHITVQAEDLDDLLSRNPVAVEAYKPRVNDFSAKMDSSLSISGIAWPLPNNNPNDVGSHIVYDVPEIGEISDALVKHIRAVAYIPEEEVREEQRYETVKTEANDIDFVTVEGKIDVTALYERFEESFGLEEVEQDFGDPCLTKPIFAAVQLQRQEKLDDGSWGQWQKVSRSKVESRREMFEVIEDVRTLPAGGLKVRLLQYDNILVQADLLQPEAYKIASSNNEWFPPSLYEKYKKYQDEVRAIEKREKLTAAREEEKAKKEKVRSAIGRNKTSTRKSSTGPMGPGRQGGGGMRAPGGVGTGGARRAAGRGKRDRLKLSQEREKKRLAKLKESAKSLSVDSIYEELEDIRISEDIDLGQMDTLLTLWANDDTVECGKSYRYRLRVGVFNPIAGTNQFGESSKHLKNKVVLWSKYCYPPDIVDIPQMSYFFPNKVQESTNTVTLQVFKYELGYWYSEKFTVEPGELIGEAVKAKKKEKKGARATEAELPETIDYSTGAVLVDVVGINDWTGDINNKIKEKIYHEMLYSLDGDAVEHMPIKVRYWPEKMVAMYHELGKQEKDVREPLRPWDSRAGSKDSIFRQPGGMMPGGGPMMPGGGPMMPGGGPMM